MNILNKTSITRAFVILGIIIAIILLERNNKKYAAPSGDIEEVSLSQTTDSETSSDENRIPAKEIVNPTGFINTENNEPITLAEHIGDKIILVDFWTYSCINCQRTLPHLTAWHETYADDGLLIVGLHRPEFEFEKDIENVKTAVKKWNIKYPVVLDNNASTWRAYKNRYWPRKYIINLDGNIVYDHIGEGAYEETEKVIQGLLADRAEKLGLENSEKHSEAKLSSSHIETKAHTRGITPELYLGSGREENRFEGDGELPLHNYTFGDNTEFEREFAHVKAGESLELHFYAKEVHLVTEASGPVGADIYLDDKLLKTHTFNESDLSTLVELDSPEEHTLRIDFKDDLDVYAFTFG